MVKTEEDPIQEFMSLTEPQVGQIPTISQSVYSPPSSIYNTLNTLVTDFETFEMNPNEIYEKAKNSEYIVSFKIKIRDKDYQFDLQRNDLRSADFISAYTDNNGLHETKRDQENEDFIAVKTFKGIVNNNSNSICRFFIDENYISGLWYDSEKDKWLSLQNIPTFLRENNAPISFNDANKFVFFYNKNLTGMYDGICGISNKKEVGGNGGSRGLDDVATCDPKILEIATEADFDFFSAHGANAKNNILERLNQAEAIYSRSLNMFFSITSMHIWETATDPYSTDNSDNKLFNEFLPYWNANFPSVPRDLAILFSGIGKFKGIAANGSTYLINGSTYNNTSSGYGIVCNTTIAYAIIANNTTYFTVDHEIGHALDAPHPDESTNTSIKAECNPSSPPGVMCSGNISGREFYFTPSSLNTVRTCIDNNIACLSDRLPTSISFNWVKTWSNERNNKWIGSWYINNNDVKIEGDFDGDNEQELFYVSESAKWSMIQDFQCDGSSGPDWMHLWSNNGNGTFFNWRMNKGDRYYTGDFDGDGKDEVLSISYNNNYAHLNGFDIPSRSWNYKWANNGNHWIGSWYVQSSDQFIVSDFTGDGKEDLFCVSKSGWSMLQSFNGISWTHVWSNGGKGWIGHGCCDGVPANTAHRYHSGYITQTSRTDLFTIYGTWATISTYNPSLNRWDWSWSQFGGGHPDVAGWWLPLKSSDWVKISNIDNDNQDEIQFLHSGSSPANWVETMDFNGSYLVQNWNNGGSGKLADMNLSETTNYQSIKPYIYNTFQLLAIKNQKQGKIWTHPSAMYRTTQLRNYKTDPSYNFDTNTTIDNLGYKVYPNPNSNGVLHIVRLNANKEANGKLFDITGKLIREVNINSEVYYQTLTLQDLNSGIYFLTITDGTQISNHKILIK